MKIAQKLYEGVDLGGGEREGLITYMRTDSLTLSEKALSEAGGVIAKLFGENYHHRRQFATKSKMAQEAHEAIRPTQLSRSRTPSRTCSTAKSSASTASSGTAPWLRRWPMRSS
jgi:DNA topoisomerase-1